MNNIAFGLNQINKPTPQFALWAFRIYFFVSKSFLGWLATVSAEHLINLTDKQFKLIVLTITLLIDPVALGLSKCFGINADQSNTTPPANEPTAS